LWILRDLRLHDGDFLFDRSRFFLGKRLRIRSLRFAHDVLVVAGLFGDRLVCRRRRRRRPVSPGDEGAVAITVLSGDERVSIATERLMLAAATRAQRGHQDTEQPHARAQCSERASSVVGE
jgi:hypothetical protein